MQDTASIDPILKKKLVEKGLNPSDMEVYFNGLKNNTGLTPKHKIFQSELQKRYGANHLFTGKGYTKDYSGNVGVREWWVKSKNGTNLVEWNDNAFESILTVILWK